MLERSGKRTATVHASYGPAVDLSASDPAVRAGALDSTLRAMELAAELNAPIVVLHASVEPIDDAQRTGHLERVSDSLRVVAEQCRRTGRQAAVELLPRTCLGHTADELLHMVGSLDPEVIGVCVDTNHLMDRPHELAGTIRTLAPRLLTLHLSDYDGVDEKHWLPGRAIQLRMYSSGRDSRAAPSRAGAGLRLASQPRSVKRLLSRGRSSPFFPVNVSMVHAS